jgi:chromosome segregation ATPase
MPVEDEGRQAGASRLAHGAPADADGNGAGNNGGNNGELWGAQERLWQNEHQSAEQAVALVERDQQISAISAERDWLAAQLEEERDRRQTLDPELDMARAEWSAAAKRASDFEAAFHHASERLRGAEMRVEELAHNLEIVKSERSEAVFALAGHQEEFSELKLALDSACAERTEMEQILGRARANLEQTQSELAAAEAENEQSSAEAAQMKAGMAHLRAELGLAIAERDKLQALVREDHELAEYAHVKEERDRLDAELKEAQAHLGGFRERIEALSEERESLKRDRTELQLKVAALRDAHDNSQLEQDNEVLRRMVERLNEELKQLQPEGVRRKKGSTAMLGDIARAAVSRCFVPDPDVAEGR